MPQFGGAAEKCNVCAKTVFLTEKIVVEDKEDKKTFHKTCLKCSHCSVTLTLGNYASMGGVFYCKPHFKQLFATKGNYDEGFGKDKHTKNWTPQAATSPTSFIPVDKDDGSSGKKETPTSITSKFGRTTLNTDKCHACDKTVYATEKTVIEEKEGKKVFHKTCLKCSHCGVIVTLGNYAAMQGTVYCKPHFKQLFAAKGNYEEGFGKEKPTTKWEPQAVSVPSTFVPVDKDDGAVKEKKSTPDSVASKFTKGSTTSEKCTACGKTVYLTEKIVVEDKEDKQTYHKTCLRCKHCQVVLTLGNYASMNGVMYCKPHFKQLFATKGNYNEGFGKEKLTKKWTDKEDGNESPAEDDTKRKQEDDTKRKHEDDTKRKLDEERERENRAQAENRAHAEKEERLREEKEIAEEKERVAKERDEKETRRRAEKEAELEKEREEEKEREREEREREERKREEREREEREQEEREEIEREKRAREERQREAREEREREEAEEREREERERREAPQEVSY